MSFREEEEEEEEEERETMSSMELRQALAGVLTLSMFIMLGNMVKKDHLDPYLSMEVEATPSSSSSATVLVTGQNLATVSHLSKEIPKENGESLKPCWNPPLLKESEQSEGFITFSLTNGPEYHLSQIADAVVVARSLGATLVLPDIRSTKQGYRMNFGDIYDVQKFIESLNGIVKVTRTQPPQASNGNLPTVKVPNRVTEDYIERIVKPIYQARGSLRIESNFPSSSINNSTMASSGKNKNLMMNPVACKAMFGSLQLKPEVQEVVASTVQKLRTWSQNLNGKFVAVDLKTEMCNSQRGRKSCYNAEEVGEFLKKLGFNQETVVYVTQPRWDSDLDALKNIFPKTYTKESVIPEEKSGKFLDSEKSEYEKVIDFNICSESDVFVPSLSGLFYTNVAAMRIASGKNQILVPSDETASASASDFISPYVSQKTHFAYSCFC